MPPPTKPQEWANVNNIQLASGGTKTTTTFKAEEELRSILQVRALRCAGAGGPAAGAGVDAWWWWWWWWLEGGDCCINPSPLASARSTMQSD